MKSARNSSLRAYESNVSKPYAELGEQGSGVETWGYGQTADGRWINIYGDKKFIGDYFTSKILRYTKQHPAQSSGLSIVDAGGGDGSLLNEVTAQLEEAEVQRITPINLDLDPSGRNFSVMSERKKHGKYRFDITGVQGDIMDAPIKPNSVDIVISRHVLQYFPQDKQIEFFQHIDDILKPDGQMILTWPASPKQHEAIFNELWGKISSIITAGVEFKRHYPSWSISGAKKIEAETDLSLVLGIPRAAVLFVSPQSFQDRFNLNPESVGEIKKLFDEFNLIEPELFEEIDDILCFKHDIAEYFFEKKL